MQIRTILHQYIKTLIKHVFLLNFTYELLMILEDCLMVCAVYYRSTTDIFLASIAL